MIIVLKRALYQKEFGNAENKAANTLALIQPKIQQQQKAITDNNSFGGFFTGQNRKNKKAAEQLGQQLSTIKSGGAGSEADRAARIANKNWTTADVQANMIHDARAERNAGTRAIVLPRTTTTSSNPADNPLVGAARKSAGLTDNATATPKQKTINNDMIVRGSSNMKGQYADESKKVAVRSMEDSLANKGTLEERRARLTPEQKARLEQQKQKRQQAQASAGANPTSTGTNPATNPTSTATNPTSTGTNPATNPTTNPTSTATNPTSTGTNPATNPTSTGATAGNNTNDNKFKSVMSGIKTDAKNVAASAKTTWGNMSKGGKAATIAGGSILALGGAALAASAIRNKRKAKEAEERARDAERRAERMRRRGEY